MLSRTSRALAAAVTVGLVVTAAPAASAAPDWRTERSSWSNDPPRVPRVLDLRYATHANFDRVVLDLRRGRPGYDIRYVRHLRGTEGSPVPLAGRRKMQLSLFPARARTYEGPTRQRVDFPTLRGIRFIEEFESQVEIGFGTRSRAPYRVFFLHDPRRLVIDWRH